MDITHIISSARGLFARFGSELYEDKECASLLSRLRWGIEGTRRAMHELGVVAECADCALHGEGTCCSMPTAYKCDRVLLLINLMMKVELPQKEIDPASCYFLSQKGCILSARPVICVNFTCARIQAAIPSRSLIKIQEIAGQELTALFLLEDYLKKKISKAERRDGEEGIIHPAL